MDSGGILIDFSGQSAHRPLVVIVAVRGEGEAIIDHFDLTAHKPAQGLTLFGNQQLLLGISGKGPRAASDFCSRVARWLSDSGRESPVAWVNFGSAGSSSHVPGTLVQAKRIGSDEICRALELCGPDLAGIPGVFVQTSAEPVSEYLPGRVHDMEALGFVQGIRAVTAVSRLCILKVITDGPEQPLRSINRAQLQSMLDASAAELIGVLESLFTDRGAI